MNRKIFFLAIIIFAMVVAFIAFPSESNSEINKDYTTYPVQIYGPSGNTGCYTGPASGNFTITGGHISVDLPAGTYTFCINGGCNMVITVPQQSSVSCNPNNPKHYCDCAGS